MKKTGRVMKKRYEIFLRWLVLAVTLSLLIPVGGLCSDVTAHVDKTRISLEDSVFLTVEINGGKANLDLSNVSDFKVVSRGSSSSYNFVNGRSERKATYQYVLIPLKKGVLKIPPIQANRDGRIFFTQEIIIHVSDQAIDPSDARDLFAEAYVEKQNLFVGEQTVYSLKFFTSKKLSGLGFEKPPEFIGFVSKQFEKEQNYSQNINGVLYHVTQVNYVIIPEREGTITINPAVLIANVIVKSRRDPRFDSFFTTNSYKPVRIITNSVHINAVPTPSYQGPGNFSGLVGRFEIQGDIDKKTLKAGESATLTIKISGSGNIMDAGTPKIHLDDTVFKVYDDTPVESIHLTEAGYEGSKTFKKAIVPINPGAYAIEPISLTYFDVNQKAYQTVSIERIKLTVLPSEQVHLANKSSQHLNNARMKQEVFLENKDIFDIKEGLQVLEDYQEITLSFFAVFLSIPGLLFIGITFFVKIGKKDVSVERQMKDKAKYHLKQAGKMRGSNKAFLGHLYSSLVAVIMAKGGKKGETVTIREAEQILKDAAVEKKKMDQITGLLETIESVRFGGKKIDENRADQILAKVKQTAKMICVVLTCIGMFLSLPENSYANDPTRIFIDGVENYRKGDFIRAAHDFETIAQQQIKNPYLFYNIANAYLKANDIGRAILWYERAKVMAPDDPDLIYNLKYANTLVKDKKETLMNVMDIIFFWDKMVQAKTIQFTAIFLSILFFSWAGIRVIQNQKIFSGIGIMLCAVFVLITMITFVNYYKKSLKQNAVIISEKVAVRSGTTETSTKLFGLHAGTKVSVKEQRKAYLKIQFSKDKIGWVRKKDAEII